MAVLDGQRDPAAGQAGDVPGDGPAEAAEGDRAVRVVGDRLAVQPVLAGVGVDPGDELGDALLAALAVITWPVRRRVPLVRRRDGLVAAGAGAAPVQPGRAEREQVAAWR